jgi:multidrug efflux system membrane fusion protein
MRHPEKFKIGLGRRTRIALVVGTVLALGGGAYLYFQPAANKDTAATTDGAPGGPGGKRRGPPGGGNRVQPVKASEARIGDLDVALTALGTVTASNTAVVKPRVDGQLVKINFREGQLVKAGDVLAEIDPRPFQVLVDQAHGQLLKDQALLSAALVDLDRYRGLLAKDSIAKQQVDTQDALVRQYRGMVETDKAQEDNARLNLDFSRIKAPAAGRLGLRLVDVGNMVHSSDTNGIVVITQTQPIYVVFAIPSESLGNIVGRLQNGDSFVVEAWNRDGKAMLAAGKLLSVDNQIDVTTGTVKLKAEFSNKDNSLFPNQFVNARLKVETRRASVLLPSAAVQRNAQGTYVYVIKKDEQTVEPRPVKLGPASGELTVIDKGLAAGEQVVLDGADKLRPGVKVDVMAVDGQAQAGNATAQSGDNPPNAERRQRRGDGENRSEGRRPAEGERPAAAVPVAAAGDASAGKREHAGPDAAGSGWGTASPEERQKRWAEINLRIDRGEFGEEMKKLPEEERRQRMREMRRQQREGGGQQQ